MNKRRYLTLSLDKNQKKIHPLLKSKIIGLVLFSFFLNFSFSQELVDLEAKLDSIIQVGIDSMAFPGAQLIVATKDSILIEKSYGFHTYGRKTKVENDHLYDLASVTKVTSGLLLLMKMVDAKLIDLDEPISKYLPLFCRSNKKKLTLRQVLAHQAGLEPYIVFWQKALNDKGEFKRNTFQNKPSKNYPIKITDSLFLHKKYKKKMEKAIKKSPVIKWKEAEYRYSGLVFLLLPDLIENVLRSDFEKQLQINFFDKLKLEKIGYNPLSRFPLEEIVPTENDTTFRKSLVQGRVHDEAAAMLNSKSCNAGLFSNARDLVKIFQVLMNNGKDGENLILTKEIIEEFTACQYPERNNRRGLGFDKPLLEYKAEDAYVAKSASASSFGHSGFTGTFVWADPEADIILVFLSNRVYPSRSHRMLYQLSVRPEMHQACYDFLLKFNSE